MIKSEIENKFNMTEKFSSACTKLRCQYKSQEVPTFDDAKYLLESHLLAEHGVSNKEGSKGSGSRPEKVRRPEISPEMSTERWSYFLTRWESYKEACGLTGKEILLHLKDCMDEMVREDHHNQFSGVEPDDETGLLTQIKSVMVKKANRWWTETSWPS